MCIIVQNVIIIRIHIRVNNIDQAWCKYMSLYIYSSYIWAENIKWNTWCVSFTLFRLMVLLMLFSLKHSSFPFSVYSLSSGKCIFVSWFSSWQKFLYKKRDLFSIRSEFTWLSFKQSVATINQIINMKVRLN